jgi:Lrp/AsnC family transcriptional regulator, leucine-responsive regulatory protein
MSLPSNQRESARFTFETPSALDVIDRRIVAELQREPRLRVAELARRVGLSSPAVAERLRRLEDTGILSYHAEVDPRALGYTMCAIVRISPVGGGLRLIPGIAREVPNVTECHRITGEDCYFIKVYLRSIGELEPILDLFTPHGRTTTSIVHSSPVPPRPLPVPEGAPPVAAAGGSHEVRGAGQGKAVIGTRARAGAGLLVSGTGRSRA